MRSLFDLEEANIILSALSDMDDFFLPKSIPRRDLYTLAHKFMNATYRRLRRDGEIRLPNLFQDKFDATVMVEINLTQVEMDYIICALHAMNFEGTGYPENINLAAGRAYSKVNAQYYDGATDDLENEVWEIIVPDEDLADSKG
ncbi:MAG: hypothetical protein ACE14P_12895 [Methanotrichaceae archaeon]